jgi:hypothetical protein
VSDAQVFARAVGSTAEASLPERGNGSELAQAKYLRIMRKDDATSSGIFPVNPVVRAGADGDIFLLPGQLGLEHDKRVEVSAASATAWAYRRSQLLTTNGYLVLGVLCMALGSVWIDGSLALGNLGLVIWKFKATTLSMLAAVSMGCKVISAFLAFLLALWFKK